MCSSIGTIPYVIRNFTPSKMHLISNSQGLDRISSLILSPGNVESTMKASAFLTESDSLSINVPGYYEDVGHVRRQHNDRNQISVVEIGLCADISSSFWLVT